MCLAKTKKGGHGGTFGAKTPAKSSRRLWLLTNIFWIFLQKEKLQQGERKSYFLFERNMSSFAPTHTNRWMVGNESAANKVVDVHKDSRTTCSPRACRMICKCKVYKDHNLCQQQYLTSSLFYKFEYDLNYFNFFIFLFIVISLLFFLAVIFFVICSPFFFYYFEYFNVYFMSKDVIALL